MTTPRHRRRPLKKTKPAYSRIGTFLVISLAVFVYIVVGIRLFGDESLVAAIVYYGLGLMGLAIVVGAFMVPVTQREHAEYKSRAPMDLDPQTFDSTSDGVPW